MIQKITDDTDGTDSADDTDSTDDTVISKKIRKKIALQTKTKESMQRTKRAKIRRKTALQIMVIEHQNWFRKLQMIQMVQMVQMIQIVQMIQS